MELYRIYRIITWQQNPNAPIMYDVTVETNGGYDVVETFDNLAAAKSKLDALQHGKGLYTGELD